MGKSRNHNQEGFNRPKGNGIEEDVVTNVNEESIAEEVSAEVKSTEQLSQTETVERTEWRQLKEVFKKTQSEYFAALDKDYADRGMVKKVLGLGRKEFSLAVQDAYDKFMSASQEYYSHAQKTGHYQRVVEKLHRRQLVEKQEPFNLLITRRHILRPAEERLERQKFHLPTYVLGAKKFIQNKIKENPETAIVGGALLAFFNPAAVVTAVGVKLLGNRFYVRGKEEQKNLKKNDAIESIAHDGENARLEELEAQYFEAERQSHDAKIRTTVAAAGAAVIAGSAYGASGGEAVPVEGVSENIVSPPPAPDTKPYFEGLSDMPPVSEGIPEVITDTEPPVSEGIPEVITDVKTPASEGIPEVITHVEVPVAPDSESVSNIVKEQGGVKELVPENKELLSNGIEMKHTVAKGEVLSKIVLETLRERIQSGEVVLPEGIDQNKLAHYMYQSFPEMTSAQGIEPRLSPAEWRELGVDSGDPHLIRPGDEINLKGLIEKMRGASVEVVGDSTGAEKIVVAGAEADAASGYIPDSTFEFETSDDPTPVEVIGASGTETASFDSEVSTGEEMITDTYQDSVALDDELVDSAGNEVVNVSAAEKIISAEVSPVGVTESDAWLYREPGIHMNPGIGSELLISERLNSLVTVWPEQANFSLHEYLHKTMLQAYHTGHITLPAETIARIAKNDTALYGFIERYMPEVSGNTLSKIFRGVGSDALSAYEWQMLGIERGNPQMIAAGDQIQTGKIIQIILERAGAAINKT